MERSEKNQNVKSKIIEYLSKFGKYPDEIKVEHVMDNLPDLYQICIKENIIKEEEVSFEQFVVVVRSSLELQKILNGNYFEDLMDSSFQF